MEIKDYLHLYINACQCQVIYANGQVKNHIAKVGEIVKFDDVTYYVVSSEDIINIKLILRPLSDMTAEEEKEVNATKAFQRPSPVHHIGMMVWTAESFKLLLFKGFDLFGLIEAGLAIDKTKL